MGLFDKFSKTFDRFGYDMDGYDKMGLIKGIQQNMGMIERVTD
jgi:hypothetical protein